MPFCVCSTLARNVLMLAVYSSSSVLLGSLDMGLNVMFMLFIFTVLLLLLVAGGSVDAVIFVF